VVDGYILTEWVNEATIIEAYKEKEIERMVEIAKTNIENAKKNGCSSLKPFRCLKEKI